MFISKKRKLILVLLIGILFFSFNGSAAWAEEEETEYAEDPNYTLEVPIGSITQVKNVSEYINIVYQFGISIIGIIATVMIMYGGIKWITAAGNETRISSARETITSAVIGLVLALCSYLILFTINPRLVALPEVLIPVIQVESVAEVDCDWSKGGENDQYSEVQDSFCNNSDKPDADYQCFCNVRGNIINSAKKYAAEDNLYHECCWGWTNAVYNAAGVKIGSRVYKKSSLANCKKGDTSSSNTSKCVDPSDYPPYENILPGDWLYIFNGNKYDTGEHSVIFLGWKDQTNLLGSCASAPGAGYDAQEHDCNFKEDPVTRIYQPALSDSYNDNAGKCS